MMLHVHKKKKKCYKRLNKLIYLNINNDWNTSQVFSISTSIVLVGELNVAAIAKLAWLAIIPNFVFEKAIVPDIGWQA